MRSSVSKRKTLFDAKAWGCEDRFDTDAEKLATKFAEHLGVLMQGFHWLSHVNLLSPAIHSNI